MGEDEGSNDALRAEIMNAEYEADFLLKRHPSSSKHFRGYYADLDGVERRKRNSVEEGGGHERLIRKVLVGISLLLPPDDETRNQHDRENPERRLYGRGNGGSEIGEPLQQVKGEEDDRHPKGGLHRDGKGDVRLGDGGGVEVGHSWNLGNHTTNRECRNRTSTRCEIDLIFRGYSAQSPTRSRSSTDRIWPSEG